MVKCSCRTRSGCRPKDIAALLAHVRRLISHLLALALAVGQVAPTFAQPLSTAESENGQAGEEATFRVAIQGSSVGAVKAGTARVDDRAVVGAEWRRIGMDDIIDKPVDLAVEEVRRETTW